MRIIQDDLTTSMSCTESVLSSTYAISNLLIFPNWNIPSLPWISDSKSCFLTCTVASGMESFFISNLMADSATIQISTSTGESGQIDINTTHYSNLMEIVRNNELGTISPEWFNFSEASGGTTISSPYSGGTISVVTFAPTTLILDDSDVTLEADLILSSSSNVITRTKTGSTLGASTIVISLESTVDRKGSPFSGNVVYQWDQSSGVSGRFEDSSGNGINLTNHGQVYIGSIATIGGVDYQVTKIIGDGDGTTDVELSGSASDAIVTALVNPIKIGILRAGSVLDIENPRIGMERSFTDYSERVTLQGGGYSQSPRNVVKQFNISGMFTDTNMKNFEGFYRAFRSQPFPAIIAEGFESDRDENTRMAGFFFIRNPPQISYATSEGSYSSVFFNVTEII